MNTPTEVRGYTSFKSSIGCEILIIMSECDVFTSCAAGLLNYVLLRILSGTLVNGVTIGHHEGQILLVMAILYPAVIISFLDLMYTHRLVRGIVGTVTPSAALVLY